MEGGGSVGPLDSKKYLMLYHLSAAALRNYSTRLVPPRPVPTRDDMLLCTLALVNLETFAKMTRKMSPNWRKNTSFIKFGSLSSVAPCPSISW